MTLIGKIQIIKSFAVPKILYRLALVSVNKNILSDINQLLFSFVWNGKDKIKRHALISDIEDGHLKMPDVESIIQTQRIMYKKGTLRMLNLPGEFL